MNKFLGHMSIYAGIVYVWGGAYMIGELYDLSHYHVMYIRHKNYYYKLAMPMMITMIYGIEKIINGFCMITQE